MKLVGTLVLWLLSLTMLGLSLGCGIFLYPLVSQYPDPQIWLGALAVVGALLLAMWLNPLVRQALNQRGKLVSLWLVSIMLVLLIPVGGAGVFWAYSNEQRIQGEIGDIVQNRSQIAQGEELHNLRGRLDRRCQWGDPYSCEALATTFGGRPTLEPSQWPSEPASAFAAYLRACELKLAPDRRDRGAPAFVCMDAAAVWLMQAAAVSREDAEALVAVMGPECTIPNSPHMGAQECNTLVAAMEFSSFVERAAVDALATGGCAYTSCSEIGRARQSGTLDAGKLNTNLAGTLTIDQDSQRAISFLVNACGADRGGDAMDLGSCLQLYEFSQQGIAIPGDPQRFRLLACPNEGERYYLCPVGAD